MTQNGRAYRQQLWVPVINAIGGGALPTPKAGDGERGRDKARARPDTKGRELAVIGRMIPTPTVNDAGNSTLPPSQQGRSSLPGHMLRDDLIPTGAATHLNPSFVEEMMGYPVGWAA